MILAVIDMKEQTWHAVEVMVGIFQPALWLLLCIGFVLASAHLLTMLGTRWGDRRVSPKALIFSVAIHASLAVALLSMVKDVRRHVLMLEDEQTEPISVALESDLTQQIKPQLVDGNTPVWDRIPEQIRKSITRQTERTPVPLSPESASSRPAPIQLATRDFPNMEQPLRELPSPVPQAVHRAETQDQPRVPARSPLEAAEPLTESRADVEIPAKKPVRTPPPIATMEPLPETPKPKGGAPERITPRPLPEKVLASITAAPDPKAPLRRTDPRETIDRRESNLPAEVEMPRIGAEGETVEARVAPAPGRVVRSRSPAMARTTPETLERFRPQITSKPSDMARTRSIPRPLSQASRPSLPELARPDSIDTLSSDQLASIGRQQVPASYRMRTEQDQKDEAIRKYGGTEATQKAVERALAWLASVQEADGSFHPRRFGAGNGPPEKDPDIADRRYAGAKADTGVTALVILAMLGNGNSLSHGPYAVQVDSAVRWLIQQQRIDGYLGGEASQFSGMYCHGMATLALAEAYGMESDPVAKQALRGPLEKALRFTRFAQLQDGGWRYLPGQPDGDMSMFGWQLMALRSAQDAGIPIPKETKQGMIRFLRDRSRGRSGGLAGYRYLSEPTPTMTAESLACKQMLGLKRDNPVALEAVSYLLDHTPRLSSLNLYYWYYGTFAMFQHGGESWQQWNLPLRQILVSEQRQEGEFAGSWDPRGPYGGYGGRLYSTALATLCLEVYYRRLPMYRWQAGAARGDR